MESRFRSSIRRLVYIVALGLVVVLSGCGTNVAQTPEGTDPDGTDPGEDHSVTEDIEAEDPIRDERIVTLSAPMVDANGQDIAYEWEPIGRAASLISLSDKTSAEPSFELPDEVSPGTELLFKVALTVDGTEVSFEVSVVVGEPSESDPQDPDKPLGANVPPVPDAGSFQTTKPNEWVELNASASSDANGDGLTFSWELIYPQSDTGTSITGTETDRPSFRAEEPGLYILAVTVSDGEFAVIAIAGVEVLDDTERESPVIVTGHELEAEINAVVILDASTSYDPDGDELTFSWAQTDADGLEIGATVTLEGADTDIASFVATEPGMLYFALVISDGYSSERMIVHVQVSEPEPGIRILSDFEEDADGWLAVGNGLARPTHEIHDGRPGGYIRIQDTSNETWYWSAPGKFLGDRSRAYGRLLSFDLSQSVTDHQFDAHDVILRGAGISLYYEARYNPLAGWTNYQVPLVAGNLWRNDETGELATESELRAVLASLSELLIRGEFRGWEGESGGLDNVVLDLGYEEEPPKTENVAEAFDNEEHGWRVIANGNLGGSRPNLEPTGGRPGGFVHVRDSSDNIFWWDAPARFLGDIEAAYGHWLTYDVCQSSVEHQNFSADVLLSGGGLRMYFSAWSNPRAGWTSFQIPLHEDAEWRNADTDELVTEEEFRTVLRSMGQILIRGEWRTWDGESGGLDNVVLDLGSDPLMLKTENIVSTFDSEDHGWQVINNGQLGASRPTWLDAGGRPGGFVGVTDEFSEFFLWDAPLAFLGDLSNAYGGWLTFDVSQSERNHQASAADVYLRGGGLELRWSAPDKPLQGLTSYRVRLDETGGWWNPARDEPAEVDEILAALGYLRQVLIRGEWRNWEAESGGLDNVVIHMAGSSPLVHTIDTASHLDSSDHGWRVINNNSIGTSTPTWEASGGYEGGYAWAKDVSGERFVWDAPVEFRGDWSALYNGNIEFHLFESQVDHQAGGAVVLRGGGSILSYALPHLPTSGWTAFQVPVHDLAGWRNAVTDELATEAEIRETLAALDQVLISGEYRTWDGEYAGIDEVSFDVP